MPVTDFPILAHRNSDENHHTTVCRWGAKQILPGDDENWCETGYHACGTGLGVYFVELFVQAPFTFFLPFPNAEPSLVMHTTAEGSGKIAFDKHHAVMGREGDVIMHVLQNRGYAFEPKIGEKHAFVCSVVTLERFLSIFTDQELPKLLDDFANGRRIDFLQCHISPAVMQNIVKLMLVNPYQEPAATLYLESKLLELMTEAMAEVDNETQTVTQVFSSDRRKAMMARDTLIENLAHPPSIGHLAQSVGLSQRRLNRIFREFYGNTVSSCLTQWRLHHACDLLKEGSLSVKQVASALGYAHANNFILAFKRTYGVPPGRCRKEHIFL